MQLSINFGSFCQLYWSFRDINLCKYDYLWKSFSSFGYSHIHYTYFCFVFPLEGVISLYYHYCFFLFWYSCLWVNDRYQHQIYMEWRVPFSFAQYVPVFLVVCNYLFWSTIDSRYGNLKLSFRDSASFITQSSFIQYFVWSADSNFEQLQNSGNNMFGMTLSVYEVSHSPSLFSFQSKWEDSQLKTVCLSSHCWN